MCKREQQLEADIKALQRCLKNEKEEVRKVAMNGRVVIRPLYLHYVLLIGLYYLYL